MPTIADLIAEQEQPTGNSLADIIASEREPSQPIGDPVANRQAVADGHLTGNNPATAIDGLNVITDFEKQDPLFAESRRVGAAAVDNYLASLSLAERNAIPGSEHLDSDFPDFPGLEEVQAPFVPLDGRVVPTLGGRPEIALPTRLNELGLTREFFANIPEMVKQTFKQQAGGIALAVGEQLGQDLSWRSRLGRLAGAVAGPAAGVEDPADILPGPVRVAKELGDWATDAIAQGFGLDSALVEGGQQLRDEALARIRDLQPAEKTFLQEVITSGTQSAALALPGMAVSMITRNPTALLAAFGASTYGDSYGTARDAGKSPEEAHRFALIDAGIEVGTEIGPARIMLGASKTAIRTTLIRLFKSEMAGETLATIGQKTNSLVSKVDVMPLDQWLGELWEELKVTWATTAILTPLQGATARLAGRAVERVRGVQDVTGELQEITPAEQAAVNQKAASAGKVLKAAMFTTAGVVETDLDLSDEQVQRFIDQPELSDITDEQLDDIIGDEANEQQLISDLVDRVSGIDPGRPAFKVGDVIHELPDGTLVAGPETEAAVQGSERLATQDDVAVVPAAIGVIEEPQIISDPIEAAKAVEIEIDEFNQRDSGYPLAPRGEWFGEAIYKTVGAELQAMTPDDFLDLAKPLEIDEIARENIDDLKDHINTGKTLDPLALFGLDRTNVKDSDGRHRAIASKELGIKEVPVIVFKEAQAAPVIEAVEQRLEPFSPEQIESVPLREAVDSGLVSEDEGAVIDGFLESLPKSLRESFDVVFSGQEFEPTEAQLKAHDVEGAKGFAVRGALLERIKNEARDTIVMFSGSDVTTFFHEFGELAYKRLLTSDERKYVASLKTEAGVKVAPNEWFSDQLQSFVVQEKEEVFKPKLQKILSRVADAIRKIWERIRTTHRTPALDELFRDILSGRETETILKPKIKPPKKLYRGESIAGGSGIYSLGKGLYSTKDKSFAAKFGKVSEIDVGVAWPLDPLVLRNVAGGAQGAFMDWALKESGLRNARLFNAKYPDPGEFVRVKGFDGIIAGDEVVRYTEETFAAIGERKQPGDQKIPEGIKDRFIDEDLAEQYGQAYRSQLNAVVAQSDIEDYQAIAAEASKLAVERTDQYFEDQEKLIRVEAKRKAQEIAVSEPVSALMDEAISQGRIKLTDQIKADYGLTITEIINKRPGLFSKDGKVILDEFAIDEGGYESERDFVEAMANAPSKNELRTTLEINFINEDLQFLDQYRDELWQEQFFIEESQAITELLEKKKPAIRKDLKGIIRKQTGQVREEERTVTESEALKAAFTKAAQAARAADRAGNKEGVAKEKARMKAILESVKERKQAQERRAEALTKIKKELKATKIKKQAGKPVGKFTAEIQEIFNTLREDLKLNKVEAFNKIAANLEEHKENIPPYSVAIENRLLSVIAAQDAGIGRLGFARIQQQGLENILSEIKGLKGVGLSAREAQVSGRLTNIHDVRENIIELVGGIPEEIKAVGEKGVEKKGLEGIRHSLRNALIAGKTNSIVGWKDLLDIISFKDITSKPGESEISQFGDVLDANNAEKQGNINQMSTFRTMTFETYGLENDSDMVKKFTQDAVAHDLGEFKTKNGVFLKLTMSRAEVRKRAMEIMDPTLHDTIFSPEGMAWTQEMADAVFDFLTPQDEEFITKQLAFYQEYYESINDVYKVIYGVNLPKNINYSPIAREGISQDVESTLGEFFNEISLRASATTAGGLKSRVATKLPLRPQSDISVIQQHVSDMEHFKAWSEKIRDLNAVFGNSEVRQAIRINFGKKIDGEIQRFITDMARGGIEVSNRIATLDRMMGRYARSVLAIKPSIFLKQLTSTIAYADSVPAAYWTKEVIKFHEIPKAVNLFFDEKTGSTLIKSRWEKGDIERDISNAMKSAEFAALRAKPSFLNMMMFNVKLGDMGAIIVGGYPVYKYHRSQGLSHEEAIRRFESVTESTQQSADISQQSSWQRGGSYAKLFTMFMSSPNQYLRKEISAIRNFAAGRIGPTQFAKTMLIYHIILPMFFQLASDRFVWSGDEDEDALVPGISAEQKRAMILGSLNGFFIVGDALEAVISKAMDLKVFGFENPMWSIVNDAMKAWPLLGWDDIDPEDFIIALRGLAGATGAVLGLPGKQTVDIVTGFNDTLSGEYETGIAQMMGWSPHQAERAAERSEE